jgi:hypothetical protein
VHWASSVDATPIIVFDDVSGELEEESIPISLRFRQPSFTFLGTKPIPKGFQSLSDFTRRLLPSVRSSASTGQIEDCSILDDLPLPSFTQGKPRRKTDADLQ